MSYCLHNFTTSCNLDRLNPRDAGMFRAIFPASLSLTPALTNKSRFLTHSSFDKPNRRACALWKACNLCLLRVPSAFSSSDISSTGVTRLFDSFFGSCSVTLTLACTSLILCNTPGNESHLDPSARTQRDANIVQTVGESRIRMNHEDAAAMSFLWTASRLMHSSSPELASYYM